MRLIRVLVLASTAVLVASCTSPPTVVQTTQPPSPSPSLTASATPTETQTAPGDTFVMPGLVGQNLQLAQDRLQALGSYVLNQEDALGLDRFQIIDSNWKVCRQTPQEGAVLPMDTRVTLYAVKLDETCP
jgi:hypothetical protein